MSAHRRLLSQLQRLSSGANARTRPAEIMVDAADLKWVLDESTDLLVACEAAVAVHDSFAFRRRATTGRPTDPDPDYIAAARAAIAKARGGGSPEVVRVPAENLGDLTGTKFGEKLAAHAAKKARGGGK